MKDVIWGTWRFSARLPEIGDYVCIHVQNMETGAEDYQVGFVSETYDSYVYLLGYPKDDNWFAMKWRLGQPPEFSMLTRERKLVVS